MGKSGSAKDEGKEDRGGKGPAQRRLSGGHHPALRSAPGSRCLYHRLSGLRQRAADLSHESQLPRAGHRQRPDQRSFRRYREGAAEQVRSRRRRRPVREVRRRRSRTGRRRRGQRRRPDPTGPGQSQGGRWRRGRRRQAGIHLPGRDDKRRGTGKPLATSDLRKLVSSILTRDEFDDVLLIRPPNDVLYQRRTARNGGRSRPRGDSSPMPICRRTRNRTSARC